ncbi:MAG: LysE family transporter [Inhella sp.]
MQNQIPHLLTAAQGFGLGLSLIVAIGAQNAFVLRQGLRREHLLPVLAFCATADALLVALGVFGAAWMGARLPWLSTGLAWGGALFLHEGGLRALYRAARAGASLQAAQQGAGSRAALAQAAASPC